MKDEKSISRELENNENNIEVASEENVEKTYEDTIEPIKKEKKMIIIKRRLLSLQLSY